MNFDYTLYLVTDRQLMSCDSLTEAVEQAILGGCTMIQLREKELSSHLTFPILCLFSISFPHFPSSKDICSLGKDI